MAVNPKHHGIAVEKSVEYSYEELANATNNFSLANKIGQGGFGVVYYGELRGEVSSSIYLFSCVQLRDKNIVSNI